MEIDDARGKRLVQIPKTDGRWSCCPPIGVDTKIYLIGRSGTNYIPSNVTVHVDSHLFIWNWDNESAAIIINSDAAPQQTRSFTTAIKYNNPVGRYYAVGFAPKYVTGDLSISGTVIDPDAYYTSVGPMPSNVYLDDIKKLILLSGKGIHPIYRTPYGDWYTVGIDSVDISKTEANWSTASIKQSIVED